MFTGIISHTAKYKEGKEGLFTFEAPGSFLSKVKKGSSVSVNGVCLTVTSKDKSSFTVNLMPETLKATALGQLTRGDVVNLELPVSANGLFGGHIVQGHVDGVGKIVGISKEGNSRIISVNVNSNLARYIVAKGSIAVNGISLTVIEAKENTFSIGIIPYTFENTMISTLKVGDLVNIEVDVIAKYIERFSKRNA